MRVLSRGSSSLGTRLLGLGAIVAMALSVVGSRATADERPGFEYPWRLDGPVTALAVSPDGRVALAGAEDGTVVLFDAKGTEKLRELGGHKAAIAALAFSPDGRTALSGDRRGRLILWEVESGRSLWMQDGEPFAGVAAVAFSSDGRLALRGGYRSLALVETASGGTVRTFPGVAATIDGLVEAVAFGDGGRLVLAAGASGIFRIDLESGREEVQAFGAPRDHVVLSADGWRALTVIDCVPGLEVLDVAGKRAFRGLDDPHRLYSEAMALSARGDLAVSASDGGSIGVWEVESGKRLLFLAGHDAPVSVVALSPDGKRVLSGDAKGGIKRWYSGPAEETKPLAAGAEAPPVEAARWLGAERAPDVRQGLAVVAFIETWCPPARKSLPVLAELQRRHRASGLRIVAVSSERPEHLEKFLAANPVDLVVGAGSRSGRAFGIRAVPHAFVVIDGRIVFAGHPHSAEFARAIEEAVVERARKAW